MRPRVLLYAALALAVPLPALALTGGGSSEPADDVSLSVSASLDSCGTAADTIVCKIDASWNDVPGANRYTASVTRADGSVVDFGDVGAGSTSLWVPYVGNGTYTVSVAAYGTPPGSDKPKVVARDSARAGSSKTGAKATGGGAAAPGQSSGTGAEPTDGVDVPGPAPEPEEPDCDDDAETPDPEEPPASPEGPGGGAAGLTAEAESALDETAEAPESVECPPEPEAAAAPAG